MGRNVGRQALTIAMPSSAIVQTTVEESDPDEVSPMGLFGGYISREGKTYSLCLPMRDYE